MSPVQETPPDQTVTLIDELLADQRSLTAAQRFARDHEGHSFPSQARFYKDLIPLTRPQPGEQYAFEVNLDQCTGCKGCVTACHALNGLDEDESWRNVGLLIGGVNGDATQQTITTACHHCVDPGCLNGCPVLAYDKDPETGIVRHLDDQCIGCQYCVMKCPYDVPKYSSRLGIVRKCDMCHQRLAVGEAPACVQACPNEAIKITFASRDLISTDFRNTQSAAKRFLPASPAPDYTLPTTRYLTKRPILETLRAADESRLQPQHAHWPLIFLLVLSQASVGFGAAAWIASLTGQPAEATPLIYLATGSMAIALGVASLHLGRPLKAWRAFLGWRTSWFSREAIAFGAYMSLLSAAAAATYFRFARLSELMVPGAVLLGVLSIACSFMLYVDTRREFWSTFHTGVRFFGSTILFALFGSALWGNYERAVPPLSMASLAAFMMMKLAFELTPLTHGNITEWTALKRTARLLQGPLRSPLLFRLTCGVFGGVVVPSLLATRVISAGVATSVVLVATLLLGELAERYLFFTAVSPTQMPGGFSA